MLLAPYRNVGLEKLLEIPKKKLKIGPAEPLAFSRANRQKGKVVIIAKGEVIIGKV